MARILILDTETTGFPIREPGGANPLYTDSQAWDSCRLLEIAWNIYNIDGTPVKQTEHLIKPDYPEKKNEEALRAFDIHKISFEEVSTKGTDLKETLLALLQDIDIFKVELIVAHNVDFDKGVILSEMYRLGGSGDEITKFLAINTHCTMKTNLRPDGRWYRLSDRYKLKTGLDMKNCHRAKDDTEACAKIYFNFKK